MPEHDSVRARLRRLIALPLLTLVVLVGASALGPVAGAEAAGRHHHHKRHHHHHAQKHHGAGSSRVARATGIALGQVGDPYRYGATGPGSFDCSGLIYYSYRRAGISVPRTSSAQAGRTRRVAKSNLRRGDLMFFTSGGHVYHAAIFLGWKHGRAQMLHAPRTGERVSRAYAWTSSWFGGTLRG